MHSTDNRGEANACLLTRPSLLGRSTPLDLVVIERLVELGKPQGEAKGIFPWIVDVQIYQLAHLHEEVHIKT